MIPTPSPGLGYGGAEYGYSPYGAWAPAREPYAVSGGYGGSPFGTSGSGSWETIPPQVSAANALDGVRVEVFFTEAIEISGDALDPDLYTLVEVNGVPATITSITAGTISGRGYSSIIVTHTGTTLGSSYSLIVPDTIVDVSDNLIDPNARAATFIALGQTVTLTAVAQDGSSVLLTFSEDMLSEDDYSPGIEDASSYDTATSYPVPLTIDLIEQIVPSEVLLAVTGMTLTSYDVTVGPATVVDFEGSSGRPVSDNTYTVEEIGTGSTTSASSSIFLTNDVSEYGWAFEDDIGKMVIGASYIASLDVDFSGATYDPPLTDTSVASWFISDGAVQINIIFTRVSGIDVVEVRSGTYVTQIPCEWSTGRRQFTFIWNRYTDDAVLLVDGVPLSTCEGTNFDGGPTFSPGTAFVLSSSYQTTNLPLYGVGLTASSTVFTGTWNIVHDVTTSFVGDSSNARNYLMTARGPIVKDWGDATLATRNDVVVRVNGEEVYVTSVNPYIGKITLEIPIPYTDPGSVTVEVDYTWISNPIVPFQGLNTPGCVLNRWTQSRSKNRSGLGVSGYPGVADKQRFPMSIVLGTAVRPHPVQIGHRYLGFEKSYSAVLNSPRSLLLNVPRHKIAQSKVSQYLINVAVAYEANTLPEEDTWEKTGDGEAVLDSGFVSLVPDGLLYYKKDEDLSFPSSANISVRARVETTSTDGVFTGVGFGLHDDKFLYFVGFLEINGAKHVGILKDGTRPYLRSSWQIGPSFDITVLSATTFTTTSSSLVTAILQGTVNQFQIFDGVQAGRYSFTGCESVSYDGRRVILTLSEGEEFPAQWDRWGGKEATGYIEVGWDTLRTYRLDANVKTGSAYLSVGGVPSNLGVRIGSTTGYPAQSVGLFSTERRGEFFWGNFRKEVSNDSRWTFVRYGITYDTATTHFRGIVVSPGMSTLPSEQTTDPWFVTEDFGYAQVVDSNVEIRTNAASEDVDTSFGYGRLEPFLSSNTLTDFDGSLVLSEGVARDAQIRICNGEREVTFSTLMYTVSGDLRRLVTLPSVSISGVRDPIDEGWTQTGSGVTVDLNDLPMDLVQEEGGTGIFYKRIDLDSPDLTEGRVAEARLICTGEHLSDTGGPFFAFVCGALRHVVSLRWVSDGLILADSARVGSLINFDWVDGQEHVYRVTADPISNAVSVMVDGVLLRTEDLTSFDTTSSTDEGLIQFGATGSGSSRSTVSWLDFSVTSLPSSGVLRTIGVRRKTGDEDDIDGWEIPRTDATTAANSSISAVVQPMDWREKIEVRVRLDPAWGAVVFRTDLPPPPYYDGTFTTSYTEPSAGWINVEYRDLPTLTGKQKFGKVEFGALSRGSVSTQIWHRARYRIFSRLGEDATPQNHVLNYYNVISSGELLRDVTPEVVSVQPSTLTMVSIASAHMHADRVFNVVVNNTVLSVSEWTFDPLSQSVRLVNPLPDLNTPVTITFAAGKPVTSTYLRTQPLYQSVTLLNEGTPPVPKSQLGTSESISVFGSVLNNPRSVLNDKNFVLNDPLRVLHHVDPDGSLYDHLRFMQVDDGGQTGLLSIACDGLSPGSGFREIVLSGSLLSEEKSLPGGTKRWGGTRIARDGVHGFNHLGVFMPSGGTFVGPAVGEAVMIPMVVSGMVDGAGVRSVWYRMRDAEPYEDTASSAHDDAPPEYVGLVQPNPSVAGTGNGAAAGQVEDANTSYSRAGPWGGTPALAIRSVLSGGGLPNSGYAFTPVGGTALPRATITGFPIQSP